LPHYDYPGIKRYVCIHFWFVSVSNSRNTGMRHSVELTKIPQQYLACWDNPNINYNTAVVTQAY